MSKVMPFRSKNLIITKKISTLEKAQIYFKIACGHCEGVGAE
jgi:hypothetical protein